MGTMHRNGPDSICSIPPKLFRSWFKDLDPPICYRKKPECRKELHFTSISSFLSPHLAPQKKLCRAGLIFLSRSLSSRVLWEKSDISWGFGVWQVDFLKGEGDLGIVEGE